MRLLGILVFFLFPCLVLAQPSSTSDAFQSSRDKFSDIINDLEPHKDLCTCVAGVSEEICKILQPLKVEQVAKCQSFISNNLAAIKSTWKNTEVLFVDDKLTTVQSEVVAISAPGKIIVNRKLFSALTEDAKLALLGHELGHGFTPNGRVSPIRDEERYETFDGENGGEVFLNVFGASLVASKFLEEEVMPPPLPEKTVSPKEENSERDASFFSLGAYYSERTPGSQTWDNSFSRRWQRGVFYAAEFWPWRYFAVRLGYGNYKGNLRTLEEIDVENKSRVFSSHLLTKLELKLLDRPVFNRLDVIFGLGSKQEKSQFQFNDAYVFEEDDSMAFGPSVIGALRLSLGFGFWAEVSGEYAYMFEKKVPEWSTQHESRESSFFLGAGYAF